MEGLSPLSLSLSLPFSLSYLEDLRLNDTACELLEAGGTHSHKHKTTAHDKRPKGN